MKHLTIDGSYNTRDLGGLSTEDGRKTRYGVLIRSGNLDKVTEIGKRDFIDYGISTVIDIRDEWEMEHYPNAFTDSDNVSYRPAPFIGDALSNDSEWYDYTHDYVELHELYIKYIEECKPQIKAIISTFVESDSATVIHCHAGKDRTGIISALILGAVGVTDDAIANDYAETVKHIQHLVDEWRNYAVENKRDMKQFERDNATIPETMLHVLKHIRDKYQSVTKYLIDCGLSEAQLSKIKQKLVADD